MTEVLAVGLNHRTAPLEVREQAALTEEGLGEALARLGRLQDRGAILATCNRTEMCTVAGDGDAAARRLFRLDTEDV